MKQLGGVIFQRMSLPCTGSTKSLIKIKTQEDKEGVIYKADDIKTTCLNFWSE